MLDVLLARARPRWCDGALTLPGRYRFLIIFVLMWLMAGVAYLHLWRPALGIDDAAIFFVYGKHVAAGLGAVYAPGGERVEGFSSPLWMLLSAGAFALGSAPKIWLLIFSGLVVAGALAALWRFADGATDLSLRGLLLVAWVFSSPGFIIWTSLTLMDTAIWSSLLTLGAICALEANPPRLALIVALLLVTRPEGTLWGLSLIAAAALILTTQHGWKVASREIGLPVIVYGFVLGGLIVVRMAYFGYPLPNTYYAKVSSDIAYNLLEGTRYLWGFLSAHVLVLAAGVLPLLAGFLPSKHLVPLLRDSSAAMIVQFRVRLAAVLVILCVGLLSPVWIGGDHFGLFRFYQAIWPLLVLPLIELLRFVVVPMRQVVRWGLAAALIVAFIVTPQANWINHTYAQGINYEFYVAEQGRRIGVALNTLFQERWPSVGVIAAGAIALEYHGEIVDVMGLNNLAMAHAPGDRYGLKSHAAFNPDVFLVQQPDLFLPAIGDSDTLLVQWKHDYPWLNAVLKGMLEDRRFNAQYDLMILARADARVLTYVRRGYLPQLQAEGLTIVPARKCHRARPDDHLTHL